MTTLRAGVLAMSVVGLLSFFGFTKANPFSNPYELKAAFKTVNNLKVNSPVRIAGIDIGKVKKVEPVVGGGGGARITMQIKDRGLPIHKDATMKVRPRIFLEGNFFVDLKPGSPSAPAVESGGTIPITQTAAPVQFGDLLAALQADTRADLQGFLKEYSAGLEGRGAAGFNDSIKFWKSAYRNSSLANDATLGQEPTKDLQRVLKGQARTLAALNANPENLKDLVTDFNITAAAFAREDQALEASIPQLRDTLRVAQPALASLNGSLPSLRAFAREALPGVRSSNATLRESTPFIAQLRGLVSRRELRGAAAELRRGIPNLARFNDRSIPFMSQSRQLAACTNNVLVPFVNLRIPNPEPADSLESKNSNQKVREQIQRGFPGLGGESRQSDGNSNGYFHASSVPPGPRVRPGPPPDGGDTPPPHRPDVPCEKQQLPNMHAPGGPTTSFPVLDGGGPASSAGKPASSSNVWNAKRQQSGPDVERAIREFEKTWPKLTRNPRAYWRAADRKTAEKERAEKAKQAEDKKEAGR